MNQGLKQTNKKAIGKMKNVKAAGNSDTVGEMLKVSGNVDMRITGLTNSVIKENKVPDNLVIVNIYIKGREIHLNGEIIGN